MTRKTLPNRRPSITVEAEWSGHPFTVTVGYDPETGKASEVFADTAKGGQMQETIRDACVLASKLLQHGEEPADLPKSLGRVPDYTGAEDYASPIGKIAEIVAGAA
ncbi:MAG: ribonucleotide reductase [Microgenomates group bacterium]